MFNETGLLTAEVSIPNYVKHSLLVILPNFGYLNFGIDKTIKRDGLSSPVRIEKSEKLNCLVKIFLGLCREGSPEEGITKSLRIPVRLKRGGGEGISSKVQF